MPLQFKLYILWGSREIISAVGTRDDDNHSISDGIGRDSGLNSNAFMIQSPENRDLRREFASEAHRPIQKIALFGCAPLIIFLFAYLARVFPGWQSTTLLATSILLTVFWTIGYRLSGMGRLGGSLVCFVIPVSIQGALVMLLFDGFNPSALWSMIVVMAYAGFYSRRLLFISCGLTILGPIASELVRHFGIYSMVQVGPEHVLLPILIVSLCSGTVLILLLRRSQLLSEYAFHSLGAANKEQKYIIETINHIQPEIDCAVVEIQQISAQVAMQSSKQAAATSEISTTMEIMRENAAVTASNVEDTHSVVERTRTTSLESSERLKKVERGFDRVVSMIASAASEVTHLVNQMEHIEEILDFNRKIGEQIKVLAVNASIEADRAGDSGQGFGAVAAEFKNMIRDTEENLTHSSDLLKKIQVQARESSHIIIDGSNQLTRYFEDLRTTSRTVKENTERFYTTAMQVARISEAARNQQSSVSEVSSTMSEIDRASLDLRASAMVLQDNMKKIVSSQKKLEEVLRRG